MKRKTADAARGKWRGILLSLGIEETYLSGKHGPCPMCGGTDRWRWDNQHGNGGYICNQCGAGNGFKLLMGVNGWDFRTAAARVDEVVGNVEAEPIRKPMDEQTRMNMLRELWIGAVPISDGDLAHRYLSGRGVLPGRIPTCLRFAERCPVPGGGFAPAMLAMVETADGTTANIHRTFLGPNGKADIPTPRALMPGELPDGSAIRLYPVHGDRIGVAEGIETAIAAAKRFRVPVWSVLNSTMLAKWTPPASVREVLIFGDNDPKFGGQAAAYALAHRLAARNRLAVQVHIPAQSGHDWADISHKQESA